MDPSRIHLMNTQLTLDPELMRYAAQLEAEMATRRTLTLWLQPNWMAQGPQLLQSFLTQPMPQPRPSPFAVTPGAGPATPRAGEVSDLLGAVYKVPAVQGLVTRAHDEGLRQVRLLRSDWDNASTASRISMVTISGVVVGGMLAPILANQSTRLAAFNLIKGRDIPIPFVDGLSFKILDKGAGVTAPTGVPGLSGSASINGNAYEFRVNLDVMELLRSRKP